MWQTLKHIGITHRQKLAITFGLVGLENLLLLIYPVFGGWAINAVIKGNLWQALLYALVVFFMWLIGALRRSVDTRVFTHIYTNIAVLVILEQRQNQISHSAITARVALSREFVNFFEEHLPIAITSLVSIFGACIMLLLLEFWVGVVAIVILLIFYVVMPNFANASEKLYFRLNNRLEKDTHIIKNGNQKQLWQHYGFIARLRILISNREAAGYLSIGVAMAVLFGFAFGLMTIKGYGSAGHIYSISTYLWMFAMSLDDMPKLLEQYSNLKDIAQRVKIIQKQDTVQ